MKKITISGQEFEYALCANVDGDSLAHYWTEFYQGTEENKYKRFVFFGKEITEMVPKKIFEVDINIESPHYTKAQVREKLERKVELLNRVEEIKKGEII